MRSDTIVAYTYKADIYCPECTVLAMLPITGGCTKGEIAVYPTHNTEAILDVYAARMNIVRGCEWTFDSDNFPKVVFADQANEIEQEYCGVCHREISG